MKKFIGLIVGIALWCGICGCISYEYNGKKDEPVKNIREIRVFNNAGRISFRYTVLGTAVVSAYSGDVSRDRMINKLKKEAERCGANAILIVEQRIVPVESDSGSQQFTTAFDYDDSCQIWSMLYRDMDQNFVISPDTGNKNVTPGATRRIIRAEFLRYQ